MIEFTDTTFIPGASINGPSLAWVTITAIDQTRVNMQVEVQISVAAPYISEGAWQPYNNELYSGVPYNPESTDSPSQQAYTYLMTLPEFSGGVPYP